MKLQLIATLAKQKKKRIELLKQKLLVWTISRNSRDFKQSTTAGATTAAVTKKVWGEYVSLLC